MHKDTYSSRLLTLGIWFFGLATVAFMVADVMTRPPAFWLTLMPVYCLAAFALLHSFTFLGPRRALWFLALGLILPFIAEYLGANFGAIFGSHWFSRARVLRIPVDVMLPGRIALGAVLTWYGLLYVVFLSSVYLLRARTSDVSSFATVPLVGALLIALWQLAAGPATVGRSMMGFSQNGFYHHIPLSSFVGWFTTAMFIILFFQIIEPGAVDVDRFGEPEQRLAPLAFAMYGGVVLYASAVCLRMNATGAGWLGVIVFVLYMLTMAARTRTPLPAPGLEQAPSASS
jgi:uncharacterized membrane protein